MRRISAAEILASPSCWPRSASMASAKAAVDDPRWHIGRPRRGRRVGDRSLAQQRYGTRAATERPLEHDDDLRLLAIEVEESPTIFRRGEAA